MTCIVSGGALNNTLLLLIVITARYALSCAYNRLHYNALLLFLSNLGLFSFYIQAFTV